MMITKSFKYFVTHHYRAYCCGTVELLSQSICRVWIEVRLQCAWIFIPGQRQRSASVGATTI